jgi:membrane protein
MTHSSPGSGLSRGRLQRIRRFLADGVWDVDPGALPLPARIGVKAIRVVQLVVKGFRDDDCSLQASALTLSSLMAVVPILALSLALARGFGGSEAVHLKVKSAVVEWTAGFRSAAPAPAATDVSDRPDAMPSNEFSAEINALVDRAFERVERVSFAALGGIGLVFLVLMVIQVLAQVESSFNRVWGISVGRSLWRRFTDYLSVLVIIPLLLLAASTLPILDLANRVLGVAAADQMRHIANSGGLRLTAGFVMTTVAFTLFFIFMPNTKVRLGPGLLGGVVAAILFLAWLWLCAAMQIGVVNYSKLYGSFAVVPILLAWVYMSWQIILFGAEVSFAIQNHATYQMESGARGASAESRMQMALSIALEAARAMLAGGAPGFEAAAYAGANRIPVRFLNEIVDELVHAGMLAAVAGAEGRYVLIQSPDRLTAREVFDAVLRTGVEPAAVGLARLPAPVAAAAARFARGLDASLGATTLADLLREGGA